MTGYVQRRNGRKTKRPYKKRAPLNYKTVAKIARRVTQTAKPVREKRFPVFKQMKTDILADSFYTVDLTNIAQGDDIDERDGRDIYLTGLRVNVSASSASVTKSKGIRCLLVHTKNRDGDLLDLTTWTDLYQSSTFGNRLADALMGDLTYPINTDIVNVLFDKTITLRQSTEDGSYMLSKYIKIGRKLQYDDKGNNVQPTTGKYFMIFHLAETDITATATLVTIDGLLRLWYKDA